MKQQTSHSGALTTLIMSLLLALAFIAPALADSNSSDFESPEYAPGNINGQDGWIKTGPYDAEVETLASPLPTPAAFGAQSLRISNAVTSGGFGDQTFAKPLANAAGEADSTNGSYTPGTLQDHFEAEFDILPVSTSEQPGLFLSVSPDRGDGSRMSYLGFDDTASGIDVIFYDVQGTSNPANFVATTIATLNRTQPHNMRFVMDFVDGPSNDVVKIYIDGVLEHTGTSWENYYRYDTEASAEQTPRIVKTLLFRAGGTAAPDTSGEGFLIDNVELVTSTEAEEDDTVQVTIVKYLDGEVATAVSADNTDFPMHAVFPEGEGDFALSETGFNNPTPYYATTAEMDSGSDYSVYELTDGDIVGETCEDETPYRLVGYTTGDTLEDAEEATPSTTRPNFDALDQDQFVIVWNEECTDEDEDTVQVHILKYLNGQKATTVTGNYDFPMTATWNDADGAGSGNYVLGNNHGGAADVYGADTEEMIAPADYSTSEVTGGSSKVLAANAQCQTGKFRLKGYSTSAVSFADAVTKPKTTTAPSFTDITADQYVIVWNEECQVSGNACDRDLIKEIKSDIRELNEEFKNDSRDIIRQLFNRNLSKSERSALISEFIELRKDYQNELKALVKQLQTEEKQCRGNGHWNKQYNEDENDDEDENDQDND